MNKNRLIIVLGFFVAIIPILGFPLSFKKFLTVIAGLLIAYLGFVISRKSKDFNRGDVFIDSERSEENLNNTNYDESVNKTKHLLNDEENNQQF